MNAKWKCCYCLIFSIFSNLVMPIAVAGSQGTPATSSNAWFIGASGGASWLSGSSSMIIDNGYGTSPDTYSINSFSTTGTVSAEAGYRWGRETLYLPYVGLDIQYMHVFSTSVSGMVDEYSLPDYKNYNYQMNYSANNIHALLKLDLYRFQRFMPYIEGGIGIGLNALSNYQEQALAGIYPRVSPDFNSRTQTKFSYVLGAGLDFIVSPQWWITIGYQYINQGNISSGFRTDDISSNTLNPGNIQNQVVFAGISYQFFQ